MDATSAARLAPGTTLTMGQRDLVVGSPELDELRDANDLLGDRAALRARFAEDGYLLIRGLHDPARVLDARRQIMAELAAAGALDPTAPLMDGAIGPKGNGGFFGGSNRLTGTAAFQHLVGAPEIMGFFADYLGGPVRTYDFKWLRVVGHGENTGAHIDVVYMGRGTLDLYTCWTPIGHVAIEDGPLAICVGSHRLSGFAKMRATYGRMDVDRDHIDGWLSTDPLEITQRFGGRWATTTFAPGDALIFGMFTLHASFNNVSHRFRLSSDTRYQLASEPADERWVGEIIKGHDQSGAARIPMSQARAQWGI